MHHASLVRTITRFFEDRRTTDEEFFMIGAVMPFQEGDRVGSVQFMYNPTTRQLVIGNVSLDHTRVGPRNVVDSSCRSLLLTIPEIESVLIRSITSARWCRRLVDAGWIPLGDHPYVELLSRDRNDNDFSVVLTGRQ